jgi:hypothetical protein
MENGKLPAFQCSTGMNDKEIKDLGLSKREYFAGLAMQGFVSNARYNAPDNKIAEWSVELADELLKQLES